MKTIGPLWSEVERMAKRFSPWSSIGEALRERASELRHEEHSDHESTNRITERA